MTVNTYRAAIITLLIAVATLTGLLLTQHHTTPAPATNTSVSTYNDGYATSKQDDCQQGFTPACTWLKTN